MRVTGRTGAATNGMVTARTISNFVSGVAFARLRPCRLQLAEERAVWPGRWAHIAELAREHQVVRRALVATRSKP